MLVSTNIAFGVYKHGFLFSFVFLEIKPFVLDRVMRQNNMFFEKKILILANSLNLYLI